MVEKYVLLLLSPILVHAVFGFCFILSVQCILPSTLTTNLVVHNIIHDAFSVHESEFNAHKINNQKECKTIRKQMLVIRDGRVSHSLNEKNQKNGWIDFGELSVSFPTMTHAFRSCSQM